MDKFIKIGVKYIKISAFLVLILVLLYMLFAFVNMFNTTFYSFLGLMTYILLQVLFPVYGGLLLFFILFLLAECFQKNLIKEMEKK